MEYEKAFQKIEHELKTHYNSIKGCSSNDIANIEKQLAQNYRKRMCNS
jgi:hypothetical protein